MVAPEGPERTIKGQRGPRDERGVVLDQITRAARESFAELGWAGTTMRSVARDANVDPALVRYYFPTKEALLEASLVFPPGFVDHLQQAARGPLATRGEALVRLLLENWANPDSAATLRSGIQAASHVPIARERVSQLFRTSVLPAVAHSLDDERMERAGLVASQLIGLAVTRYVWRLEPIRSMPDEDVIRYVAPTIQRYLSRRL